MMIKKANPAKKFHEAAGHLSRKAMRLIITKNLAKNPGYTIKDLDEWTEACHGCMMGKATRLPFKGSHVNDGHAFVYFDVFGKTRTAAIGNFHYFIIFVKARSRMLYAHLLQRESDLPSALEHYLSIHLSTFGDLPTAVLCDNAKAHLSKEIDAILGKRGITRKRTIPHCSEQNPAEIMIRHVCTIARTMMQGSNRPLELWGLAVQSAVYMYNRLPCSSNPNSVSPFEMEFNAKPDLKHIKTWGSTVYAHLPHDARENARGESLDAAAEVGILVGYAQEQSGYLVYFPNRGAKLTSILSRRHVQFAPPGTAPSEEDDAAFRLRRRNEMTSSTSPPQHPLAPGTVGDSEQGSPAKYWNQAPPSPGTVGAPVGAAEGDTARSPPRLTGAERRVAMSSAIKAKSDRSIAS